MMNRKISEKKRSSHSGYTTQALASKDGEIFSLRPSFEPNFADASHSRLLRRSRYEETEFMDLVSGKEFYDKILIENTH
jgi:hypothetical protein